MKTFIILPIWVIARMITPFLPAHHPWYGKRHPLSSWVYRGTPVAYLFGAAFWWHLMLIAIFGIKLLA